MVSSQTRDSIDKREELASAQQSSKDAQEMTTHNTESAVLTARLLTPKQWPPGASGIGSSK